MSAQDIIDSGLYSAAVNLMDDELREELHDMLFPCSDFEFLSAYMEEHFKKFGIPFCI